METANRKGEVLSVSCNNLWICKLSKAFKNEAGKKEIFRHSKFGDMCMGDLGGVCKVDIKETSTSNHVEVTNKTILITTCYYKKNLIEEFKNIRRGIF